MKSVRVEVRSVGMATERETEWRINIPEPPYNLACDGLAFPGCRKTRTCEIKNSSGSGTGWGWLGAAVEGVELSLVKNWQAFISSLTGHCNMSCSCPRDPILLISFCFPFENQRNPVKNSRGGTFFHSQLQDLFFRKFFGIFQDTSLLKFCTSEILFPVEFSSLLKSFNILPPNFRKFFFRNSSLRDHHLSLSFKTIEYSSYDKKLSFLNRRNFLCVSDFCNKHHL